MKIVLATANKHGVTFFNLFPGNVVANVPTRTISEVKKTKTSYESSFARSMLRTILPFVVKWRPLVAAVIMTRANEQVSRRMKKGKKTKAFRRRDVWLD